MSQFAVFVVGPAGVGKSTFCSTIIQHCQSINRSVHLINLDPAAENFAIEPSKDIRDLVTLDEAMQQLELGPNGGLVCAMEHLLENPDWLLEDLGGYDEDYVLVDCPGQIELYTHYPIMRQIIGLFAATDYRCLAAYLLESHFMDDESKFFAGVLNAMSTMVQLEIPHINVLTKMDIYLETHYPEIASAIREATPDAADDIEAEFYEEHLAAYLEPSAQTFGGDYAKISNEKFGRLNEAIVQLIDDFNMVAFTPLNITRESSVQRVLAQIDFALQYGEHREPKEPEGCRDDCNDNDDDDDEAGSD